MGASDSEGSRVLRERGVRRESEDFPSQPWCVYLNGQDDRHGKAAKRFSDPKRIELASSLLKSQQDRDPRWLGGFLQAASPLSIPLAARPPRNRILSLSVIGLRPV